MKQLLKSVGVTEGTNEKGRVWLVMGAMVPIAGAFGPNWMGLVAFSLLCFVMASVNFRIKGSGITEEEGDAIKEVLSEPMDQLLKDGRE